MAKFVSGTSGNPKGRPPKGKNAFYCDVISAPNLPKEYDTKTFLNLNPSNDCIPFGSNNLFPQEIANINRNSPIHRGILNKKVSFISGVSLKCDEREIKLKSIVESANPKESLHEVLSKLIHDKLHFGNAILEIVCDSKKSFVNFYHKDFTTARVGVNGDTIKLHSDWEKISLSQDKAVEIPLFPRFKKNEETGYLHSTLHMKDYEAQYKYYGLPSWISALNSAVQSYKINKWNLSRIENGFNLSGVLLLEGNMTEEQCALAVKKAKEEWVGEGKQGKVMMLARNLGDGASKVTTSSFTPIQSGSDADWGRLHEQCTKDLLTAHSWTKRMSMLESNGWSQSDLKTEFDILLSTTISPEQERLLSSLKKVFDYFKINSDSLMFENKVPISITVSIDQAEVVGLIEKVANGVIPRDSALNVLNKSFGLSVADADAMLGSAGNGFKPKI
ncbi:MAG: hypothetical protein ACRC37_03330 [Lentisphaeria bacterium]